MQDLDLYLNNLASMAGVNFCVSMVYGTNLLAPRFVLGLVNLYWGCYILQSLKRQTISEETDN
jgi:hypothetical protein